MATRRLPSIPGIVLAFIALSCGPAFAATTVSAADPTGLSSHFHNGDLVRLRSGGPLMTVESIKGNQADCFWTDLNGQPNDATFPTTVLQKF